MGCDVIKAKIEEFVYEKSVRPDEEMIGHIANCTECRAWLKNCQSAEKITRYLSQLDPVIADPQRFTSDILLAVEELEPKTISPKIYSFGIVKKFLVAATAALFIIFSYEQYIFVRKLTQLEVKMSAAPKVNSETDFYKKVITYYPDKGMEMVKSELAAHGHQSRKMNFKSLIMMAGYSVLSTDDVVKQVQNQTFSNKDLSKQMIKNR